MPPPRQRNGSINRIAVGAKSASSPRRTCASSYKFRSKELGNRTLEQLKDASTTTAYTYHPGGQIASIRYPGGLKVFYRLGTGSNVGRIVQVDVQQPGATSPVQVFVSNLAYTALNQPKSWNWSSTDSASRSFDASGRMVSNEFATYSYDAASRITGISQTLWATEGTNPFSTAISWTAGYDNRDRLTSFTRAGAATQYSYDANSNRLSSSDTITSSTDLGADFDQADRQKTTAQTHTMAAASNRLLGFSQTQTTQQASTNTVLGTSSTQVNYQLDAAGNLTSDGLRSFSYDASNRLSQVQVGDSDEASKVVYLHNAQGQRVFKSEPQVAQAAPNEATLGSDFISWLQQNFSWLFSPSSQSNALLGQSYVYGDGALNSYNLLGEYGNGSSAGQGSTEYLWLPTETGSAQLIGLYKNTRFYAVHTDHLGTPRKVTDDAGKVAWQWTYSAFGDNKPTGPLRSSPKVAAGQTINMLKATQPTVTLNLRFPGQYWDDESKLSYNYFRSYQPGQGRYTQSDPIGQAGGPNPYLYAGANPLIRIDPLGLDWQEKVEVVKAAGIPGAMSANDAATQALKDAQNSGLPGLRNGPADAFRHCVWSCAMTKSIGQSTAKAIGDQHEDAGDRENRQPKSERAMDEKNNAEGRACGVSNDTRSCQQMCMDKYMTGSLYGLGGNPMPAPPPPNPRQRR